jgi:glutamine cyclotransferase
MHTDKNIACLVLLIAAASPSVAQTPVRVLPLQGKTAHVQGIDTDGTHLWVTSVDRAARKGYLQEFAVADGRLERSVEVQEGDRFHPGGITADANSIWLPVAEYKASSSAVIQRRSKRTLALESEFSVPDHVGCIAITPELIIGGNWDSRDFYVWDHQGKLIRKVASTSENAYQDLKVRDGQLVASGLLSGRRAAVDWLDLSSTRLIRRVTLGNTDRGEPLTREGMTVFENRLWLLPEDGDSRLFVFEIPRPGR